MKKYNITIIGAGGGGRAFAAYFARKEHNVSLGFRTYKNIGKIIETKEIVSSGKLSGTFKINSISADYKEIIPNADIILFVVPANTHVEYARKIIPYLKNNQIILLNPGRTWGAIQIYNEIKRYRPFLRIHVGETQTLLFTSRSKGDYGVSILKIKSNVNYCFYPNMDNYLVRETFDELIPELNQVDDIRITSLNNIGAMIHPAVVVLNSGSIHRTDDFLFYKEGVIEPIANVIEEIDKERCKILEKLDVLTLSFLDWVYEVYDIQANTIYEAMQKIPSYTTISAPQTLKMRYITEDVPTGLVPLASMGKYLRVNTPKMDSVITICDCLIGQNFRLYGRTTRNVGLPLKLLKMKNGQLDLEQRIRSDSKSYLFQTQQSI